MVKLTEWYVSYISRRSNVGLLDIVKISWPEYHIMVLVFSIHSNFSTFQQLSHNKQFFNMHFFFFEGKICFVFCLMKAMLKQKCLVLQMNVSSHVRLLTSRVPTIGCRSALRHWYGMPALQKCQISNEFPMKLQIPLHPISTFTTLSCILRYVLVFLFIPQHRHWSCCKLKTTHENTETIQATQMHMNLDILNENMNERHCKAKKHTLRIHS